MDRDPRGERTRVMSHAAEDRGDLDPRDWEAFRRAGHQALDGMVDFLASIRTRPVWVAPPDHVRHAFLSPLPSEERDLQAVLDAFDVLIKPYATGNLHPAFMGWVHGAGTPVGMVAEMLAAGLNANCGGRDHIAIEVERQITRWMAQLFGFPDAASGLFLTGTSMANFVGLLVARTSAVGATSRTTGIGGLAPLCAYASAGAHGCVAQAMAMAGLGTDHLRRVPCDGAGAMRLDRLAPMIAADREAGLRPFLIVGTAGSVDVGAIDDLKGLADLAASEGLWFHVDGAFGALAALAPALRPLLVGIERADSIAFDFHKWLHVPYDAGFLLVRDGGAHRAAFASDDAYLTRAPAGLAAGEVWPCDLGPDLSRGFRALKTWFTLQTYGTRRLGDSIARTCALAAYLAGRLRASPQFRLAAPVTLNIVCFTVTDGDPDPVNRAIVQDLHLSGLAAPSLTLIDGSAVIRVAIVNHRTTQADIDAVLAALAASRDRVLSSMS